MTKPADFESDNEEILALYPILQKFMESHYPPAVRPARRPVHTKTLGLVEAEFEIDPQLPDKARFGIFGKGEPGRRYPAWIRFSNAATSMAADSRWGILGMAIKLPQVRDGKDQDFLLINSPVFFLSSMEDFVDFVGSGAPFEGGLCYATYILHGFSSGSNPLARLWNLARIVLKSSKTANPLTDTYWSTVPFRLDDSVVKYVAKPGPAYKTWQADSSPDFLRNAMKEYLNNSDAEFDFMVQFQKDPSLMPIEDPTVQWDENVSPPLKVATIRIPRQAFDSPARMTSAETMFFAPWNTLREHEPVGQINRVRKALYDAIGGLRAQMK